MNYFLKDFFADQWQTDLTCISEYSFLYVSVNLLLLFTFPSRFPVFSLKQQACSSHYLPISFCKLCFCSCLIFFSSSFLCLLSLPKFSPKFGSSFSPFFIINFLTLQTQIKSNETEIIFPWLAGSSPLGASELGKTFSYFAGTYACEFMQNKY